MDNEEKIKKSGELYHKLHQVQLEYLNLWLDETLFHWEWWVSLFLTIAPWLLWIKLRRKESTSRLLFAGFFIIIITSWLDFIGIWLGLWYYSGKLIPTIPSFAPWDFCIFPVTAMLLIQFKLSWSPFFKAVVFAGLNSFVGEPLAHLYGFYTMVNWEYMYSFPIYFIIYLIAYWISNRKNFEKIKVE